MAGAVRAIRARPPRTAAVLALGAALAAVLAVVSGSGGGSYSVTAEFSEVNGLVEGAPVEVAGIRVGKVESIGLGADGLPRVAMSVSDRYPLHRGASADLRVASASGEQNAFVELSAGQGPGLPPGTTLQAPAGSEPVTVADVLSTFNSGTRENVHAALAGLDATLTGQGGDLAALLRNAPVALGNTAEATRQVDSDRVALRSLVESGGRVAGALASSRDALGTAADRLASVLAVTAGRQRELAQAAARLPAGLRSPTVALNRLDGSIGTLRALVGNARPAVERLVPFARALRPAMAAARPTLDQAAHLATAAPAELRKTQPLLKKAIPTLRRLAPTLRSATPILNQARVRTPDFFSFFSNWADFTSVYDANGHAARVGLVLPPAPDNVIDGSDSGAGQLAAPFVRTPGVLEGDPWANFRRSFLGGRR